MEKFTFSFFDILKFEIAPRLSSTLPYPYFPNISALAKEAESAT
jgi:hypothetical protein